MWKSAPRTKNETDRGEGITMCGKEKSGGVPLAKKYVFICYSNSLFIDDNQKLQVLQIVNKGYPTLSYSLPAEHERI